MPWLQAVCCYSNQTQQDMLNPAQAELGVRCIWHWSNTAGRSEHGPKLEAFAAWRSWSHHCRSDCAVRLYRRRGEELKEMSECGMAYFPHVWVSSLKLWVSSSGLQLALIAGQLISCYQLSTTITIGGYRDNRQLTATDCRQIPMY